MAETFTTEVYAEILLMAYMGVAEFEDLEPSEQIEAVKKMAAAIEFMETQGSVIVPKEPTDEQRKAGGECHPFRDADDPTAPYDWRPGQIVAASCYRAMLAAKP